MVLIRNGLDIHAYLTLISPLPATNVLEIEYAWLLKGPVTRNNFQGDVAIVKIGGPT
jgi:hypothetical protein